MILDVTGDLFTHGRQLKQLVFNDRIISLLGKLLMAKIVVSEEAAIPTHFELKTPRAGASPACFPKMPSQ